MQLSKLQRVLDMITVDGKLPPGDIGVNSGGEVTFYFASQLERWQHDYLKSRGFVFISEGYDHYAYRPRIRKSKRDALRAEFDAHVSAELPQSLVFPGTATGGR